MKYLIVTLLMCQCAFGGSVWTNVSTYWPFRTLTNTAMTTNAISISWVTAVSGGIKVNLAVTTNFGVAGNSPWAFSSPIQINGTNYYGTEANILIFTNTGGAPQAQFAIPQMQGDLHLTFWFNEQNWGHSAGTSLYTYNIGPEGAQDSVWIQNYSDTSGLTYLGLSNQGKNGVVHNHPTALYPGWKYDDLAISWSNGIAFLREYDATNLTLLSILTNYVTTNTADYPIFLDIGQQEEDVEANGGTPSPVGMMTGFVLSTNVSAYTPLVLAGTNGASGGNTNSDLVTVNARLAP